MSYTVRYDWLLYLSWRLLLYVMTAQLVATGAYNTSQLAAFDANIVILPAGGPLIHIALPPHTSVFSKNIH